MRPQLIILCCSAALIATSCKSPPTSVLLKIVAGPKLPRPDALRLSVFGEVGLDVADRALPACDGTCPAKGSVLPGEVVLYPKEQKGRLRVLVRAQHAGKLVGEGTTSVDLREETQVEALVVVNAGPLPDRDGDGVPDIIDSCADVPNPQQGPCASADGRVDGRPDAVIDATLDVPPVQDGRRDVAGDTRARDSKTDRPRDSRPGDKPKTDKPKTDLPKPPDLYKPPDAKLPDLYKIDQPVGCLCPLGCRPNMSCRAVVASNGYTANTYVTPPVLGAGTTINTTTCQLLGLLGTLTGTVQSGACVFALTQLTIPAGVTVKATGDKPLVFLVESSVTISGVLDVGGHKTTAGPGGGVAGVATASVGVVGGGAGGGKVCGCTAGTDDDCGGGGGGYATAGGAGGRESTTSTCTSLSDGGPIYGSGALTPLVAGSGGATAGQLASTAIFPASGGAGGGALQIACRQQITINGSINAGGGAGGVAVQAGTGLGGGGGGSGGAVLLEAATFAGSGVVAANGGGGAAANSYGCASGEGEDGGPGVVVAQGGTPCVASYAKGGAGGGNVAPVMGGESTTDGGGGGGGAAGRIRFNWYLHGSSAPLSSSGGVSTGEVTVN